MSIELIDIGTSNPEPISGVTTTIFIAPHSDFELINDCPAFEAVGSLETKAVIAAEHTFKTGKGFTKLEIVTESGTIKTSPLGENERKLFQNELSGKIAGSDAKLLGFMRMVKNEKFVVLVEENGTGNLRQLGSKRLKAMFSNLEHNVEGPVEGDNALSFTILDKQKWPAPIYQGDVTEKPTTP